MIPGVDEFDRLTEKEPLSETETTSETPPLVKPLYKATPGAEMRWRAAYILLVPRRAGMIEQVMDDLHRKQKPQD